MKRQTPPRAERHTALTENQSRIFEEMLRKNHDLFVELSKL